MYPRPSCNDLLGFPVPRAGAIVRYITHKIVIFQNNFNRQSDWDVSGRLDEEVAQ